MHTPPGGILGFATYEAGTRMWNSATDGWVLSLLSAAFAYLCVMASNYFKLDVSAKLSAITFLLVTFGGDDGEHGAGGGCGGLRVFETRISMKDQAVAWFCTPVVILWHFLYVYKLQHMHTWYHVMHTDHTPFALNMHAHRPCSPPRCIGHSTCSHEWHCDRGDAEPSAQYHHMAS